MIIDRIKIVGDNLTWILRCPIKEDAKELSELRVKMDGETRNLDREPGEGLLTWLDFEDLIDVDTKAIQLYQKYGFVEEGMLTKDRKHKDGSYDNTVIMGRFIK